MKRFLWPLALVLTACAPQSAPPPQAVEPPPRPPATAVPASPPARAFDESLLTGKEFLLQAGSGGRPPLRDFELGRLTADIALRTAAEHFFEDAADGAVDESSLVPRWAPYLKSWALGMKGKLKSTKNIRVGDAVEEGGALMAPVRLWWDEGGYAGWLAVEPSGAGYLISDVQISETAPRAVPFDPESPQEISSPNLR